MSFHSQFEASSGCQVLVATSICSDLSSCETVELNSLGWVEIVAFFENRHHCTTVDDDRVVISRVH